MSSKRSNKSAILCTAISVMLATLAAETSAQAGSTPARQLSDAVAEVLRSPFHGDKAPLGLGGSGLLLPVVAYPSRAQDRVNFVPLWSTGLPNAEPLPAEVASPPNRLFGLTVFAAIGSHVATALFLRCQDRQYGDPARYTGSGRPGVIGFPSSEGGSLCPSFKTNSNFVEDGFLLLVPPMTTAGAATLSGKGFVKSVGGSALGYLGSLLFYKGMTEVVDERSIHDLAIPVWILGGLMHGITTAYLTG